MSGGFSRTGFHTPGFDVETAFEPGVTTVTTVVTINGIDVTNDIDYGKSEWTMNAGINPGTAKIFVRDLSHAHSFAVGTETTLDINGLRVWGGYVMGIHRGYAFDVDNTANPTATPRYILLECSDYNILFQKRFVLNKADPTLPLPQIAAGTWDSVIVKDLVANYVDFTGDGIQTAGVKHVGTPIEDMAGAIAEPPQNFGQAMRQVALMPGAIFYFDAYKNLNYADVDIPNAPFKLSDQPDNETSFGYGMFELLHDGTSLGNDALVWGAAVGVNAMTFQRYQNEDSIAEHGLWQWADYRQSLYKPESVLKRATTYVDGSVQNNRGHKDDAISIRCRVRQPGLRAGLKVDFRSWVHGYHDVIPIRSMRIKFANPNEALYELYLAHYLDEAWITAERGDDKAPSDDTVTVCEQPATVCTTNLLVLDSFNTRDLVGGLGNMEWGTASSGPAWLPDPYSASGDFWVNGSTTGVAAAYTSVSAAPGMSINDATFVNDDFTMTALVKMYEPSANGSLGWGFTFRILAGTVGSGYLSGHVNARLDGYNTSLGEPALTLTTGTTTPTSTSVAAVIPIDAWFRVKWQKTGTSHRMKIWVDGSDEPSTWAIEQTGIPSVSFNRFGIVMQGRDDSEMDYDWIEIETETCVQTTSRTQVPNTAHVYDTDGNEIAISIINSAIVPDACTIYTEDFEPPDTAVFTADTPNASGLPVTQGTGPAWGPDWSCLLSASGSTASGQTNMQRTGGKGRFWTVPEGTNSQAYVGFADVNYVGETTSFDLDIITEFDFPISDALPAYVEQLAGTHVVIEIGNLVFLSFNKLWKSTLDGDWVLDTCDVKLAAIYPGGSVSFPLDGTLVGSYSISIDIVPGDHVTALVNGIVLNVALDPSAVFTTGYTRFYFEESNNGTGPQPFHEWFSFTPIEMQVDNLIINPCANTGGVAYLTNSIVCYETTDSGQVFELPLGDVYRPAHVRQLGWGSQYDGLNCTMASACIALDRHTMGAKTATPPEMRAAQLDQVGGTDLNDADYAWNHGFSEDLDVRTDLWATFVSRVNAGRGAIVQGGYQEIPDTYSGQPSFDGPHAIYVNEFSSDGNNALVYDPLRSSAYWLPKTYLIQYAYAFAGNGLVSAGYTQITS